MTTALIIAAAVTLFVLLPCIVITILLFGRKTIYDFDERPQRDMRSYEPYIGGILSDMAFMRSLKPEELSIESRDGLILKADWYPRGSKKTIVFAHGFCSTPLNNFSSLGRAFYERGWNVLTIWQRGHGKSGGRFTTMGIKEQEDLLLWIDKAESLAPDSRIALYGISMGGATVAYAADKAPASVRVIGVDCSYRSPFDQMCRGRGIFTVLWMPIMPLIILFSWLVLRVNITKKTTDSLSASRVPAVFMIGLSDKTVPPGFFRALYDSCSSEKELIEIAHAPHALAFSAANEAERERLFNFIERSFK